MCPNPDVQPTFFNIHPAFHFAHFQEAGDRRASGQKRQAPGSHDPEAAGGAGNAAKRAARGRGGGSVGGDAEALRRSREGLEDETAGQGDMMSQQVGGALH